MTAPELEKLIRELNAWCDEEPGRQIKIAEALGVSKGLVNDWLKSRRRTPNVERFFQLQAFLRKQRGKKAK